MSSDDKLRIGVAHSSDIEVLRRNHEFVRDDPKDASELGKSWEKRMARRYYDKLYKEYVVADLSQYSMGRIGLRWRVENEVLAGLGQDICGGLSCGSKIDLRTFEVPFQYEEHGDKKAELVKLRLCGRCSEKLKVVHKMNKKAAVGSPQQSQHGGRERDTKRNKSIRKLHDSENERTLKKMKKSVGTGDFAEEKKESDGKRRHSSDGSLSS